MQFIKDLARNLLILIVAGYVIYLISPDIMGQVYHLFGALFGPFIIVLLLVVTALPRRRRSRR